MRLRVKNVLIQAREIRLAKKKIKILQCFPGPERFHSIRNRRIR